MSKGLKITLWIVAILVVLSAFTFFWGKSAWDKISFSKPQLQSLDMQGLSLADIANIAIAGQSKNITATMAMNIKNDNNFSIPFGKMALTFFYNNIVIAQTSDAFSQQDFTIPANGTLSVSDTVSIILNKAGAQLIAQKIKGKNPTVDYTISVNVFGMPIGWLIPKQSITL